MKKLKLTEATASLTDYIYQLDEEALIVLVDNHPVAALMSFNFANRLTNSFNLHPQFVAVVEQIKAELKLETDSISGQAHGYILQSLKPECSVADYVRSLREKPVILTKLDQPMAVLLPIHDADIETVSLSLNPEFIDLLQESRVSLQENGGISLESLREELDLV